MGEIIVGTEFLKIKEEIKSLYPNFNTDDYLPSNISPFFTKEVRMYKKFVKNLLRRRIGLPEDETEDVLSEFS